MARGFGALTPEQRRELGRRGALSLHAKGKAHRWTAEEAKIAGAKGGKAKVGKRWKIPRITSSMPPGSDVYGHLDRE